MKQDTIEELYSKFTKTINNGIDNLVPYLRRLLRFLALPYCYLKLVNWKECTASRYQVFKDLLYIFFRLKYFPDNYSPCRLWEKKRSEWRYYYGSIYDPYQRGRLRKEVQRKEYEIVFEDKYVCYQLCKAANLPLPPQYARIDPDDDYKSLVHNILNNYPNKKLIIKPLMGKGGVGIFLTFRKGKKIIIKNYNNEILLNHFELDTPSVVQQYINQHENLSRIAQSINTVRIVTLLTKEKKILIIGAMIRFGVGDTFIDNTSMGGIGAGIDIDRGAVKKIAYDSKGKIYHQHPNSGFIFEGFQIPYWSGVVGLAKRIQMTFSFYKLLCHDIAITPEGPTIIEINAAHDNVRLEQKYGPILADKKVREEFKKYDLLINKLSWV